MGRTLLDHPGGQVDAPRGGGPAHPLRFGARHGDGGVVVAPEGAPARRLAPADRGSEAEAPRVPADECFWEDDQFGAVRRRLGGRRADVLDGGGRIEGVAARLDGGDADVVSLGHLVGDSLV